MGPYMHAWTHGGCTLTSMLAFCATGWAVSAFFGYLKGVANELALKHVPHVAPRNDTLAGPLGRRGDQVCLFFVP